MRRGWDREGSGDHTGRRVISAFVVNHALRYFFPEFRGFREEAFFRLDGRFMVTSIGCADGFAQSMSFRRFIPLFGSLSSIPFFNEFFNELN